MLDTQNNRLEQSARDVAAAHGFDYDREKLAFDAIPAMPPEMLPIQHNPLEPDERAALED